MKNRFAFFLGIFLFCGLSLAESLSFQIDSSKGNNVCLEGVTGSITVLRGNAFQISVETESFFAHQVNIVRKSNNPDILITIIEAPDGYVGTMRHVMNHWSGSEGKFVFSPVLPSLRASISATIRVPEITPNGHETFADKTCIWVPARKTECSCSIQ